MLTTILCSKPHVAAFIEHHFSRQLMDGLVTKLPKTESAVYNAVGHHVTIQFHDRILVAPPGMQLFKAALPKPYERHFLKQASAVDFGKSLEDYFWTKFKEYVLLHIHENNMYKDHVIKAFMESYGITESIYPLDHFRRQCTRMKIRGLRDPIPHIRERIHRNIADHICLQMFRIYRDRRLSARCIADHYGFHRRVVERIIQKINMSNMSKTVV